MTRFRTAVEEWRASRKNYDLGSKMSLIEAVGETDCGFTILIDVVKAVDAYERTIAQLKKQNTKLRRDRKAVAEAGRPG